MPDEAWETESSALEQAFGSGHRLELPGLGTLELRDYPAYEGRNPHTGQPIMVKASRGVVFLGSPELQDQLQRLPATMAVAIL